MPISDLPIEILSHILQQLGPHNSTQSCAVHINTLKAVNQVNKTWHTLAVPILYRKVDIESITTPDSRWHAYRFLQLLNAKPEYYRYVRHLRIVFETPDYQEIRVLAYLLKQCRFVHTLSLGGSLDVDGCSELLDQIMDRTWHRVNLQGDCRDFLAMLVTDYEPLDAKIVTVDDELPSLEPCLPTCLSHSNIDKLSVDADILPMPPTERRWPARLKALRYNLTPSRVVLARHLNQVLVNNLQTWVSFHRETLEIIELMSWRLRDVSAYTFDLDFSNHMRLKTLRLHLHSILEVSPRKVSSRFPSCLENLEVDVMGSEREDKIWALDLSDISWLETFFSVRQQTVPDHQLKSIMVHYTFNDFEIAHCRLTGCIENNAWPCWSLDKAASALKSYDVVLIYSKPYMDKAAWKTMIREQTVPGWEYYNTKEERMGVASAQDYKNEHFDCGDYIHDEGGCRRVDPLPEESDELTPLIELDGNGCRRICSYFNKTCRRGHPVHVSVARDPETPEGTRMRRNRNYAKGFTVCHDCLYPACAKTISQEQRWEELCDRRQLFA